MSILVEDAGEVLDHDRSLIQTLLVLHWVPGGGVCAE